MAASSIVLPDQLATTSGLAGAVAAERMDRGRNLFFLFLHFGPLFGALQRKEMAPTLKTLFYNGKSKVF